MKILAITAFLALASLALAACGGAQDTESSRGGPLVEQPPPPPQPVHPSGSQEARATVTRAGGTFSLTSGARLEIPEGAIAEPVEVSFHVGAEGHAFGDRERQRPLGPLVAVEPSLIAAEGSSFTVSVPAQPLPDGWSPSDLAFAMEEVDTDPRAMDSLGTQTRWQFYPVTVENNRFVARVTGLPGNRLQFGVAR